MVWHEHRQLLGSEKGAEGDGSNVSITADGQCPATGDLHQGEERGRVPGGIVSPGIRPISTEGFAHFSVIVGPKGFPDYQKEKLAFPDRSPFLKRPSLPRVQAGLSGSGGVGGGFCYALITLHSFSC